MNNSLAIVNGNEWQAMLQVADALVSSGFLPVSIKTPQQAVAIILAGRELGIGPWQAVQTINVIQGKPTVSPQLMLALINASGQLEDIVICGDDRSCEVVMKRKGRQQHVERFDFEDATKLGLANKDNYRKQPAIMLRWRAVAACARVVFPDVILGLYTPDEMGADVTVTDDGAMQVVTVAPEPVNEIEQARQRLGNTEPRRLVQPEPKPEPAPEPAVEAHASVALWTSDELWDAVADTFKARPHFDNALPHYIDPFDAEYQFINDSYTPLADAAALIRLYRSRTGKADLRVFEDEKAREKFVGLCAGLVADDRAIVTTLDSITDYPVGSLSAWKGDKHTAWAAVLARSKSWQYEAIEWPANAAAVVKSIARYLCAEADGQAVTDAQFDALAMP